MFATETLRSQKSCVKTKKDCIHLHLALEEAEPLAAFLSRAILPENDDGEGLQIQAQKGGLEGRMANSEEPAFHAPDKNPPGGRRPTHAYAPDRLKDTRDVSYLFATPRKVPAGITPRCLKSARHILSGIFSGNTELLSSFRVALLSSCLTELHHLLFPLSRKANLPQELIIPYTATRCK